MSQAAGDISQQWRWIGIVFERVDRDQRAILNLGVERAPMGQV